MPNGNCSNLGHDELPELLYTYVNCRTIAVRERRWHQLETTLEV